MIGDEDLGSAPVSAELGIVVIGRNEGERLVACLASLPIGGFRVAYVDSGSTDSSVQVARDLGLAVVPLDAGRPFSAARARNAGAKFLLASHPELRFIKFIDGDCVLRDGWLAKATTFMERHANIAIVCGRRRERRPSASVYNFLCDLEWDTRVGQALTCGGDCLARADAFQSVGGFDESLMAGEEPELCVRLRAAGWTIWRLDAEMTLHDAAMTRFGQWWRRSVRGGFAMSQGFALYWRDATAIWRRSLGSALFWGLLAPAFLLVLALWQPVALVGFLVYPAQISRIAIRRGVTNSSSWKYALFVMLAKFAEMQGVVIYLARAFMDRKPQLIEYKTTS